MDISALQKRIGGEAFIRDSAGYDAVWKNNERRSDLFARPI